MEITATLPWRVIGATLVAIAVSSGLAFLRTIWEEVRILVIMQIVWSALGAAVISLGIVVEGAPPLEWINVAILAGFGAAFTLHYSRLRSA